jgi:hypothetical protein
MKRSLVLLGMCLACAMQAKAADMYLFYNASSDNLDELGIKAKEVAHVFDGEFGPASEELPLEVKYDDFYVSKYPDGSFVFVLKAPFNCGQLGCNNVVFVRDEDGDLIEQDAKDPVKCKNYDTDKLLCVNGGYQPEVKAKPRKKILHFPAPQQ